MPDWALNTTVDELLKNSIFIELKKTSPNFEEYKLNFIPLSEDLILGEFSKGGIGYEDEETNLFMVVWMIYGLTLIGASCRSRLQSTIKRCPY